MFLIKLFSLFIFQENLSIVTVDFLTSNEDLSCRLNTETYCHLVATTGNNLLLKATCLTVS